MISSTDGGVTDGVGYDAVAGTLVAAYYNVTIQLGTGGISVTTGTWYFVDVRVNASANPHTIDIQVNGVAATQQTFATAAQTSSAIALGSRNSITVTQDAFFDDVIISNTVADYPIGNGFVNHFVLTTDTLHNVAGANDFERTLTGTDILNTTTDSYLLVDEIPFEENTPTDFINMVVPPNATDYTQNKFGPAPGINTPTTAPRAVEAMVAIAQAGTGNGNMHIRLNDIGTEGTIYTATTVAGTVGCTYKRAHFATQPSGGAWTVSNFNIIKIRFGSPGAVDANPDQYFVNAVIEAEFAPLSSPNRTRRGLY
jgi:hypothetical protein